MDKHFAVLIDSDNVSDKYIKIIFDELSTEGVATYKRIYGNWTSVSMSSWKDVLLEYSITPIQQYSYTTGKNATDSAMIIDAMDILYTGQVDGFCIVSSDSDFTKLASRLRESGKTVIGMGETKTPQPFIKACEKFKYLDVIGEKESSKKKIEDISKTAGLKTSAEDIKKAVSAIIDDISDEDGWCPLSTVGNILTKRFPDFDVRNYGYKKLTPLIASYKKFTLRSEVKNGVPLIFVKNSVQQA